MSIMEQIIGFIVAAVGGIFAFNYYQGLKTNKNQAEVEKKAAVIENKIENLEEKRSEVDKVTKEKVANLEKEKQKDLNGKELADFFNNFNKPKQ